MSTIKARVDPTEARALLERHGYAPIEIEPLSGGEASQAFGFVDGNRRLVLRVNDLASYAQDEQMAHRFDGTDVPVPRVLETGRDGQRHWAISERAPGATIQDLPVSEQWTFREDLVRVLTAIHESPVHETSGYGKIDVSDSARHPTWRAYLEADAMYDPFIPWDALLACSEPHQRALLESLWAQASDLIPACPEERALVHGDFSLDNLIGNDGRVTGVIDWGGPLYGDPLWDVAWLDLWANYLEIATAYMQSRLADRAAKRIRCYQLMAAAQALGFYLHTEQPEKFAWLADHVHDLGLAPGAG